MIHVITLRSRAGDIQEVKYFCSADCLGRGIGPLSISDPDTVGTLPHVPESDSDTYCVQCGEKLGTAIRG